MSIKCLSRLLAGFLTLPLCSAMAGTLSLEDAIRSSLQHNPALRGVDRQMQAANARAQAARGAVLPQIDLRYQVRRSDNPLDVFADKLVTRSVDPATDFTAPALNDPEYSTLHATQLSLYMPLYTGGRLVAGIQAAADVAQAEHYTYADQQQRTVYQCTQAYRAAQAAGAALTIATDAVAAAREHAETTARLVRQGRIVVSDKLTAELNLASTQSLLVQAANRQRLALEALRQVTGLPADAELQLPPWQDPAAPAGQVVTAESEARALATRTDLKAQQARLQASRTNINAARAAFQPQIGVLATESWYDHNAALDNNSQSIMGVVSLNLFNGGRDWHGLTAARHDAEQGEQNLEGLQQTIRSEVRAAASRLLESTARRQIAAQSVDKAHENVRLVKQRYGEGRTILIDLLMAERVLVEARQEELNAALSQELSFAELQRAEGSLAVPGEN